MFNSENARARLESGFWERLRQETMDYDTMVKFIPSNFSLSEDGKIATCDHCEDEFDVDKGVAKLVNHLQRNHAGYIIEEE